ncbi:MAG: transcription elongation factor GreA [Lachnospiraceae bacterium]|nr:transcription elongation factor GreA [Lachnospiraceae bacterium]
MAEAERYVMTAEGRRKLEEELEFRHVTKAKEISDAIKEAKEQGDLSENAEYAAAREAQRENQDRIAEIEHQLKYAEVVEEESSEVVGVGRTVVLRDTKAKKDYTYSIVGSSEVDFLANKISLDSPLGVAIKGLKSGQKAVVKAPSGDITYKIVSIE